jgi:hypothetical protein
MRTLAAALLLDREQRVEEGPWRQPCLADGGGVQVKRLRSGYAYGSGLAVARDAKAVDDALQAGHRVIEVTRAVAEVAAKRDSYSIQRDGSTSP